jgi:hypothetical protein
MTTTKPARLTADGGLGPDATPDGQGLTMDSEAELAAAWRALADAIRANTAAVDKLAARMDASSARAVTTRRVKAVRAAANSQALPCSDIAAMKARRALARLRG